MNSQAWGHANGWKFQIGRDGRDGWQSSVNLPLATSADARPMPPAGSDPHMSSFDRFFRLANRLGETTAGSLLADLAIHGAIGCDGLVPPYTTDEAAARLLLPPGFDWREPTHLSGMVYVSCRRIGTDDKFAYPHHGAWGKTLALAMCGTAMRARARLVKRTNI